MQRYLICDAAGCDHREDCEDITEDMIGKPCPKCGASLLTESDFRAGQAIAAVLKVFEDAGLAGSPDCEPGPHEARVRIGHHAGKTTVEGL